jgi:hypothetical protein
MFFKDWRQLDQSPVGIDFNKEYTYYVHARAWALKGWLGGTHSWIVFWSDVHNKWLVLEYTDKETIEVQQANIIYAWTNVSYQEHTPTISDRIPDAKWFGAKPIVVGYVKQKIDFDQLVNICDHYPIKNFNLYNRNCNTFTSYIINYFNLNIKRPWRSVGFKTKAFWHKF